MISVQTEGAEKYPRIWNQCRESPTMFHTSCSGKHEDKVQKFVYLNINGVLEDLEDKLPSNGERTREPDFLSSNTSKSIKKDSY
ncbi:hypothetical protein V1478_004425 [Vespula squamosa]|uniref:Uncharacterized protein n=1 Tax=Vespula squamosa TaxID=30214 RepID=A0ABD2BG67_VESSQ